MSILNSSEIGWYISHEKLVNKFYENSPSGAIQIKPELFKIHTPYKTTKIKEKQQKTTIKNPEVLKVLNLYETFKITLDLLNVFNKKISQQENNKVAQECAENVYKLSVNSNLSDVLGSNLGPVTIKKLDDNNTYVFPENCKFYCKKVSEMLKYLPHETYDCILLDPPWWNKYIRRKRKKNSDGYDMLYNTDLQNVPIEKLLKKDGLIVVWATNSQQNLDDLLNKIFKKWGIQSYVKWYWVKITKFGEPVCEFSEPPKKQPYEQIIIGTNTIEMPQNRVILSVPSAIHSHKPPLIEILKDYLPRDAVCLEVFARYLMPGWTSYGLEAIRFQHESLYSNIV